MFGKPKLLLLLIFLLSLSSCDSVYEDLPPCEVYLEFTFDHNMEFENLFDPQVESVDVFIFDRNEKLLLTKRAKRSELINGNRMALADDLEFGQYKVLTIGNLSSNFYIADREGNDLIPGVTTLDEVAFGLKRESDRVDFEFPHFHASEVTEIDYKISTDQVWLVPLIRETNKFQIRLENQGKKQARATGSIPYTFEIVTPESAVYDCKNEPVDITTPVTYLPYSLMADAASNSPAIGYLNTGRLLSRDGCNYRLIVRDTQTGRQVWSYDLMSLLYLTKPDHLSISFQEYLDRRGEWDLTIYYANNSLPEGPFLAIAIEVNGWILWIRDFEPDEE